MKFLVDAQLPKTLSDLLIDKGYDSVHTLDLPQKNRTQDNYLLKLSVNEDRIIISKDSDFLNSYLVTNTPRKLVLVKTGNIKNNMLLTIFTIHFDKIISLLKFHSLIEVSQTEIVTHK